MISTKKLLYFIAVAEEKHFGQAAIRLGISQPPLSKQIKQLENELQTQLFVRTTRSVSLTPTGKALLEHAKKIINDLEHCHPVVQETSYQANKYIRLGALHAHIYSFVPDLLRLYFNQNPNFNAHLIEYNTDEQLSKILNEAVDLGIVREPISHPEIRVKNLFQEQYVLALPDAWIKDELLNQVSITEFQHLTMISYPSHDKTRSTTKLFDDFFRQHEVQLQNKIEVKTI